MSDESQFNEEFWADMAKDLEIDSEQMASLKQIVEAIRQRIERHRTYVATTPDLNTSDRDDYLKSICGALDKIEGRIKKLTAGKDRSIERGLSGHLANVLTNNGIEKALGYPCISPESVRDLEIDLQRSREPPEVVLEERARVKRRNIAQDQASAILKGHFREIRMSLEAYLRSERELNRGGPKEDVTRNYIVANLSKEYEAIFGERPTRYRQGRFANICEKVLEEMCENTNGLESAIRRVFKRIKP